MTRPRYIVGLDLGTTHTVVAWTERERPRTPEVLALPQLVTPSESQARPLLPSLLYAPLPGEIVADPWGDAPWVLGELARRRGREVPGRLVASPKSWLSHAAVERRAPILPWGADEEDAALPRLSPVEASSRLLAHVRRAWNERFPADPLEAQELVVTVPASFDQAARELTVEAAGLAGLEARLLEEPQAAFYDLLGGAGAKRALAALEGESGAALVLVCDVGGGTTDLSLIRVRGGEAALELERVAVGRHLLVGGDNMDLALALRAEARLVERPARLDARGFGQLVLACRDAKERLLSEGAPDEARVTVLGQGSKLVGSTLTTTLTRGEVEEVVLDGFFPEVSRDARPERRGRAGLVAVGLPYEHDPAITRHIAEFFARHAPGERAPSAVLLNGGPFRSERVASRLLATLASWGDLAPARLPSSDPDLAVARGAVVFGAALAGHGLRIGGGAPQGYYVGIGASGEHERAVCVVPRGAREGERHRAHGRSLALALGRPVRFELFASSNDAVHSPGQLVTIEPDEFERLPPVATTIALDGTEDGELGVVLEGELSAIGTLELYCVESEPATREPRRFRLAFDLRGVAGSPRAARRSEEPRRAARGLDEALEALERVFGKSRADAKLREVKDLHRELERLLGARGEWSVEVLRALFDALGPKHAARRRSADHERIWWMLAGYCLRPGYGQPRDAKRLGLIAPLWEQGVAFPSEMRNWQQFFIAWRRVAGGLEEPLSVRIRDRLDPFLAPLEEKLKKPKGFKPLSSDELIELASSLERVPAERRAALGRWLLERTWTDRNPRLWAAIGRVGARIPTYASVHHVVPRSTAENWLDHLLRERWEEMPEAPLTAVRLARFTGDRARDVSETVRVQVLHRLERAGIPLEQARLVSEVVPVEDAERADFFGDSLPVGLRLLPSSVLESGG